MSSKLDTVDLKVKETREILKNNINVCIQRGEQLDDLEARSLNLETDAMKFRKVSRTLRQRLCVDNWKLACGITGISLVVLMLLIIGICSTGVCNR